MHPFIGLCVAASAAARQSVLAHDQLIRVHNDDSTFAICFEKDSFVIGRGLANDLPLQSSNDDAGWIALQHCKFAKATEGLTLHNLSACRIFIDSETRCKKFAIKPFETGKLKAGAYTIELSTGWTFKIRIFSPATTTNPLMSSSDSSTQLKSRRSEPTLSSNKRQSTEQPNAPLRFVELPPPQGLIHKSSVSACELVYIDKKPAIAKKCLKKKYAMEWHNEVKRITALSHRNIVSLLEYSPEIERLGQLPTFWTPWKGNSLAKQRGTDQMCNIPSDHRNILQSQLISALAYLESQQLVHRDIKPDNILYSRSEKLVTIVDFGYAISSNECDADHIAGTVHYLPPEVAIFQEQTHKGDIWAAGVLLLFLHGIIALPKGGWRLKEWHLHNDWVKKITQEKGRMPRKDVVRRMLELLPSKRPSASNLLSTGEMLRGSN